MTKEERNSYMREYTKRPDVVERRKANAKCGVYKIISGDDCYIGSSNDIKHRMRCHRARLKTSKYKVYQTIRERGGSIECEIVEECAESELITKEREWVDRLKPTLNSENPVRTEEEKKQQSYNAGKKWAENNLEEKRRLGRETARRKRANETVEEKETRLARRRELRQFKK